MKTYIVQGYCKTSGKKMTIEVQAPNKKHAKTVACGMLTYPKVLGKKQT